MIHTRKTTQDVLQEEMLRERAAVLARAGERLEEAFEKLQKIEREIEGETVVRPGEKPGEKTASRMESSVGRLRQPDEINAKIRAYNRQREQVRTRLYYLIVTREAMGLTHHQRLDEIYRLPPKKRCQPEG